MSEYLNIRDFVVKLFEDKYTMTESSVIGNGIERYQSNHLNNQDLSESEIKKLAIKADKYYSTKRDYLKKFPIGERRQAIADYLSGKTPKIEDIEPHNIIKETCSELQMNYDDLSEKLGYSTVAIRKCAAQNNPTKQMLKSIDLLKENRELKEQLSKYEEFKIMLRDFIQR